MSISLILPLGIELHGLEFLLGTVSDIASTGEATYEPPLAGMLFCYFLHLSGEYYLSRSDIELKSIRLDDCRTRFAAATRRSTASIIDELDSLISATARTDLRNLSTLHPRLQRSHPRTSVNVQVCPRGGGRILEMEYKVSLDISSAQDSLDIVLPRFCAPVKVMQVSICNTTCESFLYSE